LVPNVELYYALEAFGSARLFGPVTPGHAMIYALSSRDFTNHHRDRLFCL